MLRHSLPPLLTAFALTSTLFACTAGTTTTSSGNPSPTASSTSATDPPAKGGSSGSGTGSALGAQCKEYVACCEELAESNPQIGASCDSVKEQIEAAQAKGASTASYESACKSGVASFKSAGYCK